MVPFAFTIYANICKNENWKAATEVPIKVLRLNTEGIKAKGHVQALSPSPQTTRDHGSSTITDLHSGGLSLIFSLNQMGQQYTVKD